MIDLHISPRSNLYDHSTLDETNYATFWNTPAGLGVFANF